MKQDYHQPLLAEKSYHIFSRAIGNEKLFISHDNYIYFLQKMKTHLSEVADIYCYSLLPNHFHLLVRIKSESELINSFEKNKKKTYEKFVHSLSDFVMERFSNLLNSYTKSFNNRFNRKGALFLDYLKRSCAEDTESFTSFVFYIHKNAVHHKLSKAIGEWKYDSFNSILSEKKTSLLRSEVINWFGSREDFINFHKQEVILKVNVYDV
jgi:putative transposase